MCLHHLLKVTDSNSVYVNWFFLYFLLISPILTAFCGFPTQPKSQHMIISISKENFEEKRGLAPAGFEPVSFRGHRFPP